MKAIVINKDQTLSYKDVENPVLKDGEVLIEVYASALNRADLLQREGNYPPPPGCPEWPGLEVAGVIKEVANGVKKFKVGDKVCALLGGGGADDADAARAAGADTYLTGELKHHQLTDAPENGMNLVMGGHFYTENPVCERVRAMLLEADAGLTVTVVDSNPVRFV